MGDKEKEVMKFLNEEFGKILKKTKSKYPLILRPFLRIDKSWRIPKKKK